MFPPAIASKPPLLEPTPLFVSCYQFSPTANKSYTICWKHGKQKTPASPRPRHFALSPSPGPSICRSKKTFLSFPGLGRWTLPRRSPRRPSSPLPRASGTKATSSPSPPPLKLQLDPPLPQSFPQGFPVSRLPRMHLLVQLQSQVSPLPACVCCNQCKAPHLDHVPHPLGVSRISESGTMCPSHRQSHLSSAQGKPGPMLCLHYQGPQQMLPPK